MNEKIENRFLQHSQAEILYFQDFETVKAEILKHLATLKKQTPDERINARIEKFSAMGVTHDLED